MYGSAIFRRRSLIVPKPCPPEFRRRALDLPASGRWVRDVAASLSIAESCLHRWKRRDLIDRGLQALGPAAVESAALAQARSRIAEPENGVKVLRKAAAAVEQVVPPKVRFALVAELLSHARLPAAHIRSPRMFSQFATVRDFSSTQGRGRRFPPAPFGMAAGVLVEFGGEALGHQGHGE